MAERKKKPSNTQTERTVKTSLTLDGDLYVKLQAYAALRGVPANAIVCEALAVALSSVVVFDRSRKPQPLPTLEIPQA